MKKIEAMPRRRGAKPYPFDDLLNGAVWEIDPKKEFGTSPSAFSSAVYEQARRRGMKAHIATREGIVYVTAESPNQAQPTVVAAQASTPA